MVENSLSLDVNEMLRSSVLTRGSRTRGVIGWFGAVGDVAASVSYEADMTHVREGRLRLRFSTPDPRGGGGRRQIDQTISLAATRTGFGGERWWFIDDGRCVARLYLAPEGDQFRCQRA